MKLELFNTMMIDWKMTDDDDDDDDGKIGSRQPLLFGSRKLFAYITQIASPDLSSPGAMQVL
jgi:hypothetical protein